MDLAVVSTPTPCAWRMGNVQSNIPERSLKKRVVVRMDTSYTDDETMVMFLLMPKGVE
jgi:hypothetical protein